MGSIIDLARLDILHYGMDIKDDFSDYGRRFRFYAVSYMAAGRSAVRFRDRTVQYGAGDAFLIAPGVPHDHVQLPGERALFLWWNFTYLIAGCIDVLKPYRLPEKVRMTSVERFRAVFDDFMRCAGGGGGLPGAVLKQARAFELVSLILEAALAGGDAGLEQQIPGEYRSMLLDIHEHYRSTDIVRLLGEKYNLHPTYLGSRFKELYGVPPAVVHRNVRLQKAKDLLTGSGLDVSEIADELGYGSANNFTRFFKASMGLPPQEYRKGTRDLPGRL